MKQKFDVTGMTCSACSAHVQRDVEKVPGVGPATGKALMAHFKTLAAVKAASAKEMAQVKGVSRKAAQSVYDYFHSA